MDNLNDYLDTCRTEIEAELDRQLPSSQDAPGVLHEAMRYSVLSGGKRLRPVLTLAVAEALGKPRCCAWRPAAAVELLHAYTLIHDDLPCMDNDDIRRGSPTCHRRFGEANALLAGDALLTLAFEVASNTPVAAAEVVRTLAAAAGSRGVVGGQVADLAAENTQAAVDAIDFIHEHKTADLFRAAATLGALAAEAGPSERNALSVYGRALGLAFQVVDDILDAEIVQDESFSCVHIMGMPWALARSESLTQQALTALDAFDDAAAPLRALALQLRNRTV